jgi:hypothetical protein
VQSGTLIFSWEISNDSQHILTQWEREEHERSLSRSSEKRETRIYWQHLREKRTGNL